VSLVSRIDLERYPPANARDLQLRPFVGAKQHGMTIDYEVHRKGRRPAIVNQHYPAHALPGKQREAPDLVNSCQRSSATPSPPAAMSVICQDRGSIP
jgi:hypothetical protein